MLGDGHLEQVVDGMVVEPPRKVPGMLPTAIVVDQANRERSQSPAGRVCRRTDPVLTPDTGEQGLRYLFFNVSLDTPHDVSMRLGADGSTP